MRRSITVFILSFLACFIFSTAVLAAAMDVGSEFPSLTLPRLDNTMSVIKSDPNKITVVNFFASWCPYCVNELPDFNSYYLQHSDQVNMYIIDMWEKPEAANEFLYNNGYQIPAFFDNTGRDLSNNFQIKGIPVTLIIDKNGIVRFRANGMMPHGQLSRVIEKCREQDKSLTMSDIAGKRWRFGRTDGSIIATSIRLLPNGKIDGYYHPNESKWALVNGMVVFYHESGEPSCKFYDIQDRNGKLVMKGKVIIDNSGNTYVLEEL